MKYTITLRNSRFRRTYVYMYVCVYLVNPRRLRELLTQPATTYFSSRRITGGGKISRRRTIRSVPEITQRHTNNRYTPGE